MIKWLGDKLIGKKYDYKTKNVLVMLVYVLTLLVIGGIVFREMFIEGTNYELLARLVFIGALAYGFGENERIGIMRKYIKKLENK